MKTAICLFASALLTQFICGCASNHVHNIEISLADLQAYDNRLEAIAVVERGYIKDQRREEPLWVRAMGTQHPMTTRVVTQKQYYLIKLNLQTNQPDTGSVQARRFFQRDGNNPDEFWVMPRSPRFVHASGIPEGSGTSYRIAVFDSVEQKDELLQTDGLASAYFLSESRTVLVTIGRTNSEVLLSNLSRGERLNHKLATQYIKEGWAIGHEPWYGLSDDLRFFAKFFYSYTAPLHFEAAGLSFSKSPDTAVVFDNAKQSPQVIQLNANDAAVAARKVRAVSFPSDDVWLLAESEDQQGGFRELVICDLNQVVKFSRRLKSFGRFVRYAWDKTNGRIWIVPSDFLNEANKDARIQVWDYRAGQLHELSATGQRVRSLINQNISMTRMGPQH